MGSVEPIGWLGPLLTLPGAFAPGFFFYSRDFSADRAEFIRRSRRKINTPSIKPPNCTKDMTRNITLDPEKSYRTPLISAPIPIPNPESTPPRTACAEEYLVDLLTSKCREF